MDRLMLEVPIRAFGEHAVAGPEYASITCPKAAPSIKIMPPVAGNKQIRIRRGKRVPAPCVALSLFFVGM